MSFKIARQAVLNDIHVLGAGLDLELDMVKPDF